MYKLIKIKIQSNKEQPWDSKNWPLNAGGRYLKVLRTKLVRKLVEQYLGHWLLRSVARRRLLACQV
jgi:hypothetical protein